jgi:RimJ/RimL family protein N-acetyltransferase
VSDAVRLRPLRQDELETLWARWLASRVAADPAGRRRARRRARRTVERSGTFHDGFLVLAVEAGGRLIGDVQARRPRYAMPSGVFELGIDLFDPGDRGRGYGRRAVEQLTDLLFAEHGAERVQASTAVHNAAMRTVLERLGYTFEGVMRAFMPTRDGHRDDYALYAVTKAEWRRLPRPTSARRGGAASRAGAPGGP